jgi:hypothetical protein
MFVRHRQTRHRLQVSLVETRRRDGKVRAEHLASIGSVPEPAAVADRIAFWRRLHERLARLGNRLDATAQAKVMAAIHARIPMVTADEQRSLQLENARHDADFYDGLADMHGDLATGQKEMAAIAERKAAEAEAARVKCAAQADEAKGRIAKIERGETVEGGLGRPWNYADSVRILKAAGWTQADIKHALLLGQLPEEILPSLHQASWEARVEVMDKAEKTARRHERQWVRAIITLAELPPDELAKALADEPPDASTL